MRIQLSSRNLRRTPNFLAAALIHFDSLSRFCGSGCSGSRKTSIWRLVTSASIASINIYNAPMYTKQVR